MKKFKRITALLCTLSIMTIAAGCGSKEDSADESATETATVAENDEATESETEESTDEAAEEATVGNDEATESDDDTDADTDTDNSDSAELDTDGTLGTLNYKYSSNWTETVADSQLTYTLSDLSGAIMIQKHDADSLGSLSEDLTIEMLAEQSEAAWASMDGMEIVSSEWVYGILEGDKKCYAVTYTYNISDIFTTNTSYFFANFTDYSKELFAVTSSALTEDSNIGDIAKEVLSTVSFS